MDKAIFFSCVGLIAFCVIGLWAYFNAVKDPLYMAFNGTMVMTVGSWSGLGLGVGVVLAVFAYKDD